MNIHQKKRLTSYFPRRWLEEAIEQCRKMTGFATYLRKVGHLHGRYISPNYDIEKYTVECFIRIMVNMAAVMSENDFFSFWNRLGQMIYKEGDSNADEFNNMYKKDGAEDQKATQEGQQ